MLRFLRGDPVSLRLGSVAADAIATVLMLPPADVVAADRPAGVVACGPITAKGREAPVDVFTFEGA